MNTAQKDGEVTKPMSVEEMLADIRKRLGRIERDLIIVVRSVRRGQNCFQSGIG